ncbi:MAG: hypothetical protein J6K28_08420 [Alistipes sp.]|nr:hypothetical protein [Alistipes sp.]
MASYNNDKVNEFIKTLKMEHLDKETRDTIYTSMIYLALNDLRAMSNDVPDELLDRWVDEWQKDGEDIPAKCRAVSVFGRVFMFVQFARQYLDESYFDRTRDADPQAMLHAITLVQYIRLARETGRIMPDFDIFDVERYDEITAAIFAGRKRQS